MCVTVCVFNSSASIITLLCREIVILVLVLLVKMYVLMIIVLREKRERERVLFEFVVCLFPTDTPHPPRDLSKEFLKYSMQLLDILAPYSKSAPRLKVTSLVYIYN